MLCGYRSYSAMAEWGRNYGVSFLAALGFKQATAPCVGTLHFVVRHLDAARLEACLAQWANRVLVAQGGALHEALATDGKTLRGSQKGGAPGAHLLATVSQRLGLTLAQCAVADKTNELTAKQDMLEGLLLSGRIITADALHTQRSFAKAVLDAGGDYVLIAKENQPQLCDDIRTLFQEPEVVKETLTQATTIDLGHGRIEVRRLIASSALIGYTPWPGLQQVFQLERNITIKKTGQRRHEVIYGVTSLLPQQAAAAAAESEEAGRELGHLVVAVEVDHLTGGPQTEPAGLHAELAFAAVAESQQAQVVFRQVHPGPGNQAPDGFGICRGLPAPFRGWICYEVRDVHDFLAGLPAVQLPWWRCADCRAILCGGMMIITRLLAVSNLLWTGVRSRSGASHCEWPIPPRRDGELAMTGCPQCETRP
jgi:predicted transposase YbfD/YdcC